RSTEHEVSINSTRNIVEALDKQIYEPVLVVLSKESGTWCYFSGHTVPSSLKTLSDSDLSSGNVVNLCKSGSSAYLISQDNSLNIPVDFVLPITHGKYGEDGCLQGLCRMYNLPFAGSSVASSAVCMDKDYSKRLLE